MPENQHNYKVFLEWVAKGFVYMAPIVMGFLSMAAFDSLRKNATKGKLLARFGVSVGVSMGVYELLKLWPSLEPFTGVIIGLSSAFSMAIMTVLVNNVPDMLTELLKSFVGTAQRKLNKDDNDHP